MDCFHCRDAMLRVSSEGARFYKKRDARQKKRREASRLYKNRDARQKHRCEAKTRGKNTDARHSKETSHYRKLIGAKESLFMILSYSQDILKAKMFKDIRLFLSL